MASRPIRLFASSAQEALLSTVDAPAPANDHDLKSDPDRILYDELARRGLRLRKTAGPSALPETRPAHALPASPARGHVRRARWLQDDDVKQTARCFVYARRRGVAASQSHSGGI